VFIYNLQENEKQNSLAEKDRTIRNLNDKFGSVTPNIQLGNIMSIRDVFMGNLLAMDNVPVALIASIPFSNNPEFPNHFNNVQKVRAEIMYLDENKSPLLGPITGRWGGLQPSEIIGSDRRILDDTDLPNTGAVRWLDLLMKYLEDEYCYAFSNDSYGKPFFQNPGFQITRKRFFIEIRLRGAFIPDDTWELEVATKGKGDTFQIRKTGERWQTESKSQAAKYPTPKTAKIEPTKKRKSSPKKTSSKR
jgi:hypothetical protein